MCKNYIVFVRLKWKWFSKSFHWTVKVKTFHATESLEFELVQHRLSFNLFNNISINSILGLFGFWVGIEPGTVLPLVIIIFFLISGKIKIVGDWRGRTLGYWFTFLVEIVEHLPAAFVAPVPFHKYLVSWSESQELSHMFIFKKSLCYFILIHQPPWIHIVLESLTPMKDNFGYMWAKNYCLWFVFAVAIPLSTRYRRIIFFKDFERAWLCINKVWSFIVVLCRI